MLNKDIGRDDLCKITIVIPNYNGMKFIKGCLDSLENQSFKNFELIIVDNATQDGSNEFIVKNYPDVRFIALEQNYGFSRAVNEGMRACDSDYVVLLNNDTEVEPEWLSNLGRCISNDANVFSCSSKMIQYHDRTKIDDAGDEYNILGWAYKRGDGRSKEEYNINSGIFSSCAGAAIYRRSVFDEIGYFDENFFAYMEDVDISYRAKIHGYRNVYCSDAIVYHIGSATSGSKYNSFKIKLAARNNIYVAYKNMPWLQLVINCPFLLVGFAVKYIFFSRKGFSKEYKEGISEAFKNLKNIEKVKYSNRNLLNYVKIEIELIVNTIKYIYDKASQAIDRQRG